MVLHYMFYQWFHFKNEIPINCLCTQWKWTYILDLDLKDDVHSIMGYMDKQSSRMQGQFHFLKSSGPGGEHGLYPGSERGVPRAGPSYGKMWSSLGHVIMWKWWANIYLWRNPQQFHKWNQTECLVWLGHD